MNVVGINKWIACLILLFAFELSGFTKADAQSYGLQFSSHETVPEKRTSLELPGTDPVCFTNKLELSFDLGFLPDYSIYFGYIFRLINDKGQNIDLLYDQKKRSFRLVAGETFTDIHFELEDNVLKTDWTRLRFSIDAGGNLACSCSNKVWYSNGIALKSHCFKLIFGASNEHDFISRDVPPMRLRNIGIALDGRFHNFWPLQESSGTLAADSISHQAAKIINPVWIKPKHNAWETVKTIQVPGRPSFAFDAARETIYIVSSDSLYMLSARGMKYSAVALTAHQNLLPGNQSVIDPFSGTLYNFYPDQKEIGAYDTALHRWDHPFAKGDVTEYWQANTFITKSKNLFIIGGYGQLKYKNTIQKYNLLTKTWDTVKPSGDFFAPRYLAALGSKASTDTAYILGGYGSKEGDQLLSPRYFYDLLQYDVVHNRFTKLYTLPEPREQFVFGRSLVLDSNGQNYYALIFPNDRFNSKLQLIKGSLKEPTYTLLGASFPYSFNDVKSYADLFYCKKSGMLMAITLYTNKDNNNTEIKIFKIDFPVDAWNEPSATKAVASQGFISRRLFFILSGLLLVFGIAAYVLYQRKRKLVLKKKVNGSTPTPSPALITPSKRADLLKPVALPGSTAAVPVLKAGSSESRASAMVAIEEANLTQEAPKGKISLFGNFDVVTAEGLSLTRQFTPLLKELFLLILIDSLRYNMGVSAEKMNDILWNDKEIKDAKNNRSVNLAKLKNILEKLGGCTISRETGAWKFEYDPAAVHIDFLDYLNLFNKAGSAHPATDADKLLAIVSVGSFLQQTNYEWLDPIKAEISNFASETLLKYSESEDLQKDTEKWIAACNAVFSFDELNEHALKLKCKCLVLLGRHVLAKNTFDKFFIKYRNIYGEDFKESYHSIISS